MIAHRLRTLLALMFSVTGASALNPTLFSQQTALSPEEILRLQARPLTGTEPGLVAYYPLDGSLREATGQAPDAVPMHHETFVTGAALAPFLTSPTNAHGQVDQPFSYQITASADPTWFGAESLPEGLGVDAFTGLIQGRPATAGTFTVQLLAANAAGTNASALTLCIEDSAPVITSSTNALGRAGQPFDYQVTASGAPTHFEALDLPAPLTLDPTSGLLSGVPAAPGAFVVTLRVTGAHGTGQTTLNLTIAPASLAQTSTLQPGPGLNNGTDDGSLNQGKDRASYGDPSGASTVLPLYYSPCNIGYQPGYLQFATTGLPTQGVTKAQIQVYAKVFFNGAGWPWQIRQILLNARRVTAPWTETTLPASVAPAVLASNRIATVGGGSAGFVEFEGWLSFDVTALYQDWVNGTVPNYGIQLAIDTSYCANGDEFYVYSSDYATPSLRPKLVLESQPSSPRLTLDPLGCQARLSWDTFNQAIYQLETSTTLTNWSPCAAPLLGLGGSTNLVVSMTNSSGFYRLHVR